MVTLCIMALDEEDRSRFLRLYSTYEKRLYRIAIHYLKEPSEAEAAVQQAWLQIIQHFDKIVEIPWDETEPYVVIVIANVCKNVLKRESRYTELSEDWDFPEAEKSKETGALEELVKLIRAMPEKYRRLLELKFVLGYGNKEIAAAMGINESTVATQIERGRKLLIQRLRKEGYDHA